MKEISVMSAFIRKLITVIGIGVMFLSYASAQDEPPAEFQFNQSSLQAFYFVESGTIDGIDLTIDDWIAVFNGSTCVGAVQWTGPFTTIPAMGDENEDWTVGYLQDGDIPTFRLYDTSQSHVIYNVTLGDVSPGLEWHANAFISIASIDGLSSPDEFIFNQSSQQAFYFVEAATFDGIDLTTDDWIGVFNGDICVGSARYDGSNTTAPAMGDDGESWTDGYLNLGDSPEFRVYQASTDSIFTSILLDGVDPGLEWSNLAFIHIALLTVSSMDCAGVIGGNAHLDDCGICCDGDTGVECSYYIDPDDFGGAYDCADVCSGDAQILTFCFDNDGDLFGNPDSSNTYCDALVTEGWVEDCSDINDDCFFNILDCAGVCNGPSIVDFWFDCCEFPDTLYQDADGDTLGNPAVHQLGCNPHEDWVLNDDDPDDECFVNFWDCYGICGGTAENDCNNDCAGTAEFDDCGVCSEGNTGHIANSDMDCNDDCDGTAIINDCGCVEGNTGLLVDYCYGCTDPESCTYDETATIDDDSCLYLDCNNDCGGLAEFDECGVCDGDNTSCADCAGIPNGPNSLDLCGVCDDDPANDNDTMDCNDDCDGTAIINDCGCVEGNTGLLVDYCYGCTDPESCTFDETATIDDGSCLFLDCSDECGGLAIFDECGVCDGDNTSCTDCAGIPNGPNSLDLCGVCDDDPTNDNDTMDCNDDCDGTAIINDCGCVEGNTGLLVDYCYGCTDPESCTFDETATIDDGSCLFLDCNDDCGGDAEDDCAGVCNGPNYEDDCGICDDDITNDCDHYSSVTPTGVSQLIVFSGSITGLLADDQIAVLDLAGFDITNDQNCDANIGEVIVGDSTWSGTQIEIAAVGSVDNCSFGGNILPGYITGNTIVVKVWRPSEQKEYETLLTVGTGNGVYGDLFTVITEITLIEVREVVINEFFFRFNNASVPDYIELYNLEDADIDMTGWSVNGEVISSGTLPAHGYFLISIDDPFYDVNGTEFIAGDNLPNSAFADITLGTSSGQIQIMDSNGILIDEINYDTVTGWPAGTANKGYAIELKNPTYDNSLLSNWAQALTEPVGAYMYDDTGSAWDYGSPLDSNTVYVPGVIFGCIDETACNYNPDANNDDGSCEYTMMYCDDIDNDGFGAGNGLESCGVPFEGWVTNCDDQEPNCWNPEPDILLEDCAEVCNGQSVLDDFDGCCISPPTVYIDLDGDGLGNPDSSAVACDVPPGWADNSNDEDDNCFSNIHDCAGTCDGTWVEDILGDCCEMLTTWYADADLDGWGNPDNSIDLCLMPEGYVDNNLDLDDTVYCVSNIFDVCGVCDGLGMTAYYADIDADMFGDPEISQESCEDPGDGWVPDNTDCDDQNPDEFPGQVWYLDLDQDTFGDSLQSFVSCLMPPGYVLNDQDCNDDNENEFPGQTWYLDFDQDGLGNPDSSMVSCLQPVDYVLNGDDLDDDCFSNYLDCAGECDGLAVEDCAGVCNGPSILDFWEDCCEDPMTLYQDADLDGLGNSLVFQLACNPHGGWVDNDLDGPFGDACESNYFDCFGICDGTAVNDCNGDCDGSALLVSYCFDDDNDNLGNPDSDTEFCDALVESDWVIDCTDPAPGCTSNILDCAGVCDGASVNDGFDGCCESPYMVYEDLDNDGLGDPNSTAMACEDQPGWVNNFDDLYPDCTSNIVDCAGVCDGASVNDGFDGCCESPYMVYEDLDNDGLGDPASTSMTCTDQPGWVNNSDDLYPDCFFNFYDCAGVCGGTWVSDNFGDCCESPYMVYEDLDIDGLGDPASTSMTCTDQLGWVNNSDDEYPDCTSNVVDCAGICDGASVNDGFDGCCESPSPVYQDLDNDGLGNPDPDVSLLACEDHAGWVSNAFDLCDDDPTNYCGNYYGPLPLETGVSQLIILDSGITGLSIGDDIGIFDLSGLDASNAENCNGNIGEILVGRGIWTGNQIEIVAIGSTDNCSFGGVMMPGYIEGNPIVARVWNHDLFTEYETTLTFGVGNGLYGDIFTSISEISTYQIQNVVINEFFFRFNNTDVPDYIELYNLEDHEVDLTGWTINGEIINGGIIPAQGHFLISTEDPFYDINGTEYIVGTDLTNSAYADITLGTSSGSITLNSPNGQLVDQVSYNLATGWPTGTTFKGYAVELKNPNFDNSLLANWSSALTDPVGTYMYDNTGTAWDYGSPLQENTVFESFVPVPGCIDETACNYNSEANQDDGSCEYNLTYYSDTDGDGFGAGVGEVYCGHPGAGYVLNNLDPEPNCWNPDLQTLLEDDCGVCNGTNQDLDCAGICFGDNIVDDCGVCDDDPENDNADMDCNGDCFGDGELDICGVCDGGNYEFLPGFIAGPDADCAGICFGTNLADECDMCDDNPDNDCVQDCNDDWGGTAQIDDCDICSDGNTGHPANSDMDCADVCFGTSYIDACLVCDSNPGNDNTETSPGFIEGPDADCAGVCFGESYPDECGVCDNNPINDSYCENENNYGGAYDCNCQCFGDSIEDDCGVCDGDDTSCNIPYANDQSLSTQESVALNFTLDASDPTDEVLTFNLYSAPNFGSLTCINGVSITCTYTPDEGYNGEDQFVYYVSDGMLNSDLATVSISITEVISLPVAQSFNIEIDEDHHTNFYLIGQSEDVDDNLLEFIITSGPSHGTLSADRALASYEYQPDTDYHGLDSFTYQVFDGTLYSETATVTITILSVNDAPEIVSVDPVGESFDVYENTYMEAYVEVFEADGDEFTLLFPSLPVHGELSYFEGSDHFTYTPEVGYSGVEVITLKAIEVGTDDLLQSSPVVIEINVIPVDDAPVVYDIFRNLQEDQINFQATLIAMDPDGDDVDFFIRTTPNHGTLELNGDLVSYTPEPNYFGSDEFTYYASDGVNESEEDATVHLTITPLNDPPEFANFSYNDVEDGFTFQLPTSDVDGDNLTFTFIPHDASGIGLAYLGGTVTNLGGGNFVYNVATNLSNWDMIFMNVTDGNFTVNAYLEFNLVTGAMLISRDAPSALDQNLDVSEDLQIGLTLIGVDLGFLLDNSANVEITQSSLHGSITLPVLGNIYNGNIANWTLDYTPDAEFSGIDSLKFRMNNPNNTDNTQSNEATILITVHAVNDIPIMTILPPVTIDEDTQTTVNVNYSDPDNTLQFTAFSTNPSKLNISIDGSSLTLVPAANYYGNITVTATVTETDGSDHYTASQSFILHVTSVNDAPVMVPISNITINEEATYNYTLSATDIDGQSSFTYVAVTDNPSLASITVNGNQMTITGLLDQSGSASVTVTANDGGTINALSNPVSFMLTVNNVNDAPIVSISNPAPVDEDGPDVVITFTPVDVDNNDLTVSMTYDNTTLFPSGSVTIDPVTAASGVLRTITMNPANNKSGVANPIITVNDGFTNTIQQVLVTVNAINDPPVLAVIGDRTIVEDNSLIVNLVASDMETSANLLVFSAVASANIGTSVVGSQLTITPTANYYGTESISVSVSDGTNTASETVQVTVTPVNDPPTITSTAGLQAVVDVQYTYQVVANDPDDPSLIYNLQYQPVGMTVSGFGLITWTPGAGVVTSGAVTLSVSDNDGLSDFEVFTISVTTNDCAGVENGSAVEDECGVCSGGTSGHIANSDMDCNSDCPEGTPNWDGNAGGTAFIDSCGNCVEGSTGLAENYADLGCGCDNPAAMMYCEDTDNDSMGNPGSETEYCLQDLPSGWLSDCSDPEPDCITNDTDVCGVCGGPGMTTYYADTDGDMYGDSGISQDSCTDPGAGWVTDSTDCDDNNQNAFPGQVWYLDLDQDGFGDGQSYVSCMMPPGYSLTSNDCNDYNANEFPGQIWYADTDTDTFGDPNNSLVQCAQPTGFILNSEDCNDGNSNINPNAIDDTCDGVDQNCNASYDEAYASSATDCGLGVCYATGTLDCIAGVEVDSCVEGTPTGPDDDCNDIDEDCNGVTDDNYPITATECGVGVCYSTGTLECVGGSEIDSCVEGLPTGPDDDCNDLDEDCSGTADDNYPITATECGAGVCYATGTLECIAGSEIDSCIEGPPTGLDDDCNGIDEDCSGTADDNYISTDTECGVGVCYASGTLDCIGGSEIDSCVEGLPSGTDDDCNDIDEDCSGTADDNYMATATECGLGVCYATGTLECVNGSTVDTCTEGPQTGLDDDCNGLDENCNGVPDDAFLAYQSTCGVGVCYATGVVDCVGGSEIDSCFEGTPTGSDDDCNGIDEDCSGLVDDNYNPSVTECGLGVCYSTGTLECVNGNTQDTCVEGSPTGPDDDCNDIDEDCSGVADDNYPITATDCGVGVCYSTGTLECIGGTEIDYCEEGLPTGADDDCNDIDEDCSGLADDNYNPPVTECGLGVCYNTGTLECVNGNTQDTCVEGPSTGPDDDCNDIDEDCSGVADDNYAVTDTECGVGVCYSTGTLECIGGTEVDSCVEGPITGADDDCNGIDEDCSGIADDNYSPSATECGVGVCYSTGTLDCVNGATIDTCTEGPQTGSDDDCNGLDENCNGIPDDEFSAYQSTCGVGICYSTGVVDCFAGNELDSCVEGLPTGSDDNCNSIDEDCSGVADDNYITPATDCGVGVCYAAGTLECVNGNLQDTCIEGSPTGTDDDCNDVDEDCSGVADDNYIVLTTECGLGVCYANGTLECVNGGTIDTCVEGSPTGADDNCNDIDEDCSGVPDDNYVSIPTECGVGECISTGMTDCVAGNITDSCVDGTPNAEICNGLDDDCDGSLPTDELDPDVDGMMTCEDTYPNCFYNFYDCADVCGGASYEDDCGVCDNNTLNDCALGCIDPLADNYDPDADTNDGSCEYTFRADSYSGDDAMFENTSGSISVWIPVNNRLYLNGVLNDSVFVSFGRYVQGIGEPSADDLLANLDPLYLDAQDELISFAPNELYFELPVEITVPFGAPLARADGQAVNMVLIGLDNPFDTTWSLVQGSSCSGGSCTGMVNSFGIYTAVNQLADCDDVVGGTAYKDNCGTCDDDPTNDCVQDCNGIWGGADEIDECGVCGGNNVCQFDVTSFHVYPNPMTNSGTFYFNTTKNFYSGKIDLYDFSGDKVATIHIQDSIVGENYIPWSNSEGIGRGGYMAVLVLRDDTGSVLKVYSKIAIK